MAFTAPRLNKSVAISNAPLGARVMPLPLTAATAKPRETFADPKLMITKLVLAPLAATTCADVVVAVAVVGVIVCNVATKSVNSALKYPAPGMALVRQYPSGRSDK